MAIIPHRSKIETCFKRLFVQKNMLAHMSIFFSILKSFFFKSIKSINQYSRVFFLNRHNVQAYFSEQKKSLGACPYLAPVRIYGRLKK